MQKKKKSEKHIHSAIANTKQKTATLPQWVLPFILLVTFFAFIPVFKAGFVNWDDGDYTYDNLLIRNFSNLKILLTTPLQGNHHPLTMLSLAINYQISGEDAWSYHLFNLLLHLINTFLVFRLALLLSNRNIIIAFTTAVLFGIHPLHVESVAWVSERKDVLYGMFFLLGLISYIKYADTGSKKQYWFTLLFLILSLLSKAAAVIFPVAIFCIDLLRNRKIELKLFLEKIPFFIPALIMGVLTFLAQKEAGATGKEEFSALTNILFGFYGIMMYFLKMIWPFNLSPFYPFPAVNESLPAKYYIAPLFSLAFAVLFFYSLKRNRVIAFGILFYLVNLLLVLQIVSVGSAVIAERYTYIPYIGLFYIIGWLIDRWSKGTIPKASYVIVPLSLFLAIITYRQSSIWENGATLWDQAIKTQPSSRAYTNRAVLLRKEKNPDLALEYYNQAISINSMDEEAYMNRGNVYMDLQKINLAYADYKKALSIKPDYPEALDNIGALYGMRGQYDSSLNYLNRVVTIKPDYKSAYKNRGMTYYSMKNYEAAIKNFEKFLEYEPGAAATQNTIGVCYQSMGKLQEAIAAYSKAIELSPEPLFYLNRSYVYNTLKNVEQARKDALIARQGGIQIANEYAASLGIQ